MNGNNYLIDTNIAIYLLSGNQKIAELLHQNNIYLSFISDLELQAFKKLKQSESIIINDFLSHCTIIDINKSIKDNTIKLRKKYKIKLPDCIIAATAEYLNIPLITADTDFKTIDTIQMIIIEPQ